MTIDMRSLAQYGAKARLAELTNEMESIVSAFPELKPTGTTLRRQRHNVPPERARAMDTGRSKPDASPHRGRRRMSAAARKAVSDRMKQYWARRRKAVAT
jgi:hypothetical protein